MLGLSHGRVPDRIPDRGVQDNCADLLQQMRELRQHMDYIAEDVYEAAAVARHHLLGPEWSPTHFCFSARDISVARQNLSLTQCCATGVPSIFNSRCP